MNGRDRRSSPWLVLALAAAAGAGLWFVLSREALPPAPGPVGEADPSQAPGSGAPATAGDREGSLAGRSAPAGRGDRPPELPAPPLQRAEAVHGRVLDTKDAPVRGAVVTLHDVDPSDPVTTAALSPAIATATSGDDGTYVVGPAPAGVRLRVRAEAAGFAAAVLPASRGARVDFVLDRGGALHLRVRDAQGAPVRGAEVRTPSAPRTTAATTDASGEVLLEGLPTGALQARVRAAGWSPMRLTDVVIEAGKTTERTCLLARGTLLAGRVVEEGSGAGVASAAVSVKGREDPAASGVSTETDGEGRFRLDGAGGPAEWVDLTATRDGYAASTQTIRLQSFPGEAQEVTLKLSRGVDGSGPTGTVVDADGRGVAGARVVYAGMPRQTDGASSPTALTDGEGRFSLALPAGAGKGWSFSLGAFARGLGIGATQASVGKSALVIRLGGAGAVVGRVTGASGEALEGAAVSLTYDWNARGAPAPAGEAQPWVYAQLFWDPRAPPLSATTDASGAFRIEGVPVGAFVAEAAWGLDKATAPDSILVRAGSTESVALSLGKGRTIEGRVLDTDGAPVAGAAVTGFDPEGGGARGRGRTSSARSDGDGVFRLRNADGERWTLTANAAGFAPATVPSVSPGDRGVEVRLTPLGRVEGQVLLDGAPYAGGFTVSAQWVVPPGQEPRPEEADVRRSGLGRGAAGDANRSDTFSSADGRFALRGLAAGSWKVNVTTTEDWVPQSPVEVAVSDGRATTGVEFRLTHGASISGVLSEDGGATVVANGQVTLRVVGAPATGGVTRGSSTTDARGRFAVSGLAGGTYTLSASTASGLQVEEEVHLDAGRAVVRDVTVPRTGSVLVTVVDPAGAPAPGVQVGFQTASGRWIAPNWDLIRKEDRLDTSRGDAWQRVQQTDAEGKNLRRWLPAGRLQVTARHSSGKPNAGPVTVDVQSDRTTEVTLTLDAGLPPR